MTNKYPVDLMWAIKRPLKDLESKPWPEYNTQSLLVEEGNGSVQYLTKYKVNGKDQTHTLSLQEVIEPSTNDVNPMIYMRLTKPVKPEVDVEYIQIG
mmetsp:Transcript_9577/g.9206  ORF Transcript_9577/g.9206 Transcript_9577/m.9206 type:complete len:97 (-) Transcript_9577:1027-1317(-)